MTTAAALTTDIRVLTYRQALFIGYFLCVLIDLTVLNLFDEFWGQVEIASFTISLMAAALLQLLLKLTLKLEHTVADHFKKQEGKGALGKRLFATWLILFGSKFVILGAVDFAFGDWIHFGGPLHGVVIFIAVVVAMLAAEEIIVRVYRRLA